MEEVGGYFQQQSLYPISEHPIMGFLQLQELLKAVEEVGGRFLITADHGNAETMLQKDKKGVPLKDKEGKPRPLTSHTLVPVSSVFIKNMTMQSFW